MQYLTPTPTDQYPRPAIVGDVPVAWWSNANYIARFAIAFGIVIGVLSLVGWLVGVPELRALGPANRAATNPMTAACFIALGCSMWLVVQAEWRRSREIARALAFLVLVVGAARLYTLLTGNGNGVAISTRASAMLNNAPSPIPTSAIRKLSANNSRASRKRPQPMLRRRAISRSRAIARATNRPATLMQATTANIKMKPPSTAEKANSVCVIRSAFI